MAQACCTKPFIAPIVLGSPAQARELAEEHFSGALKGGGEKGGQGNNHSLRDLEITFWSRKSHHLEAHFEAVTSPHIGRLPS